MNGNKILQKCIDELKGENPEIKYVLGMLEALLEMQPKENTVIPGNMTIHDPLKSTGGAGGSGNYPRTGDNFSNTKMPSGTAGPTIDEATILEENLKANLNKVDKSAISTEN